MLYHGNSWLRGMRRRPNRYLPSPVDTRAYWTRGVDRGDVLPVLGVVVVVAVWIVGAMVLMAMGEDVATVAAGVIG